VQGKLGVVGHRLVELAHQLGFVAANAFDGQLQTIAEVGAPGKVQHHLHQRLIQRSPEVTKTVNAAPILQRLRQRLSQGNAHVLIGVVVVDVQIPHGLDLEIN
jgi:hypothetical protein